MIKNSVLILILLSVSVVGVFPRPAHAFWGVVDIVSDIATEIQTLMTQIIEYAHLIYDKLWDNFLLYIWQIALEKFKLMVLDLLNQQVVSWVTKGENGVPKFIQNWETYLNGSFRVGFNSVGGDLRAAPVCGQFKNELVNSNWKNTNMPADINSLFISRIGCTLDPLLGQLGSSPQAFQNDFRNGGWLAYSEQLLKPQNRYLSSQFMASDEAALRGMNKQNAAQQQGIASKGFLPVKRCVSDLAPDEMGPPNPNSCGQFQITSPASVFESALNAGIKGRFDYIVNANQMVQLIMVVAESFANKLIKSGIDGLFNFGRGGSTPSSGFITDTTAGDCMALDPTGKLCDEIERSAIENAPISMKQNGENCTTNSDCLSLICGPAGRCISAQDNGASCTEVIQCKSHICGPTNTCTGPQANGSGCNANYQCSSSYCSPTKICADPPTNGTGGAQGGLNQPCFPGNFCNNPWNCNPITYLCTAG